MSFTVLIPARLASTRLPRKPLADIAGLPMVVRVAQRCLLSQATQVVVATDSPEIQQVCQDHDVRTVLTRDDHPTGSDRLAQACELLSLGNEQLVVNVQGDEPLIDPNLIDACAALLAQQTQCVMSTAAHPISDAQDLVNPNIVKVVVDKQGRALYFSRAPIPWWRDKTAAAPVTAAPAAPLRHIGLYAYRAGFLKSFPKLESAPIEQTESLEQLRVLWHGHRIAVFVTETAPAPGVDTPEDLVKVNALVQSPHR